MQDASAAYEYAQNWNTLPGSKRRVIAGGASGGTFVSTYKKNNMYNYNSQLLIRLTKGFFMAALIAHHCEPKPLALFSIQGINTFRHRFFNSSVQTAGEEISHAAMAKHIAGPIQVGDDAPDESTFFPEKLTPDGAKNPNFAPPTPGAEYQENHRGMLYDYYTFNNSFVEMTGSVDPGYQWAKRPGARDRVAAWPRTVIFHGNNDPDVELNVSEDMRDCLGEEKVTLIVADGQPHLYELEKFLEDDAPGMDVVRQAVARLDEIVAS